MRRIRVKGTTPATSIQNTTIAVIVTDALLTKAQTKRLAMMAQTGFSRAIYPVHAPFDGDLVFAAATGLHEIDSIAGPTELGALGANVMSRAIARGVYEAKALSFSGSLPDWRSKFG